MRLDHLLSREQGKLETASRNPRSNRVNSPEKAFCGESGGNPAKPSKRQGEKSPVIVVRVSYIVFRVRAMEDLWGFSSAGRAPALQAGGQRFDPANLHHHGLLAQLVRALA